jgi:PAS domain S-box-containing protein
MSDRADEGALAQQLRLVVDATTDYAIFMLDADGHVRTWNSGAQRIKGYTEDEIVGRHFSVFYSAEQVSDGHPDYELRVAAAEGRFAEEGWRIRRDGSRFWASVTITAVRDAEGRLAGFGKVTRDLTERKLAEDALRQAEEQFRLAFDAAPTGMALVSLDGRWLRVNDALCEITRQTRVTLLATTVQDTLALDDASTARLLAGHSLLEDVPLPAPDASAIWAHIRASTLTDSSGEHSLLVLQIEDVSARIAAHEALQDAEQAKSRFLAVASHELRSPLTAILGYSTMLHRRWAELDEAHKREAIRTIERQGLRLRLLVEDLLTLSSIEAEGMRLARRELAVSEVVADVLSTIDADITCSGDTGVIVNADPLRLSQILTNLLVNAVKYGRPPVGLTVLDSGDSVDIVVQDHGDGIDDEFVPRMFERFTQADEGLRRRSQGTGLGLNICRTLAAAHGATLRYKTREGGGACFTLSLPRDVTAND